MKKVTKKGHADAVNKVAAAAINMADKVNKAGKELKNFGKQANKAKHYKNVVSASEMKPTTIYKGLSDSVLYRRPENGRIEKMVGGKWVEAKVSYDFLNNEKFREY